jgi:hypothetical protein
MEYKFFASKKLVSILPDMAQLWHELTSRALQCQASSTLKHHAQWTADILKIRLVLGSESLLRLRNTLSSVTRIASPTFA